jgi:hypothetical protein
LPFQPPPQTFKSWNCLLPTITSWNQPPWACCSLTTFTTEFSFGGQFFFFFHRFAKNLLEKEYSVTNSLFLWGEKIPKKFPKKSQKIKIKIKRLLKLPQLQIWKQEYFSPCQYLNKSPRYFPLLAIAYYQGKKDMVF